MKFCIPKGRDLVGVEGNIIAYIKIKKPANNLKNGYATQEGIGFPDHIAGLFGQRIWFYGKTKNYSDKLKINTEKCIGCGVCTQLCPMKNLSIVVVV